MPAGQKRSVLKGRHGKAVCFLAFSPDDKVLISASYDGALERWNVATGRQTD
jgi:WD40 repeat protein